MQIASHRKSTRVQGITATNAISSLSLNRKPPPRPLLCTRPLRASTGTSAHLKRRFGGESPTLREVGEKLVELRVGLGRRFVGSVSFQGFF